MTESVQNAFNCGDWVRYKDTSCRVLGHWHDKQWHDRLVLGIPRDLESASGRKRVASWRFVGTALPETVELIKKRGKNNGSE